MLDIGTKSDDEIVGSSEDDILISGAGSDIIEAGDGDDLVIAGKGDDSVTGGAGDDLILLGHGDDTAVGGIGSDTILGGAGDDVFIFNADEQMAGDSDSLDGGRDYDTLRFIYTDATSAELAADFERLQAYLDAGDFSQTFKFEAVDLEIRHIENVELIDETPSDPAILTINGADPHNFGVIFYGSYNAVQFTLTNSGAGAATEISVSFSDENIFSMRDLNPNLPGYEDWPLEESLAAGAQDYFQIEFTPPAAGTYVGEMTISYFDGIEYQTLEKELIGQGI